MRFVCCIIACCVVVLTGSLAEGQVFNSHGVNIAVGGVGQFTASLTDQLDTPHQATTDSAGFLLTIRDEPLSWAGVELNYQYSSFSERYVSYDTGATLANVPLSFHEGTGALVLCRHKGRLTPFVGIGGGVLYFDSITPLGGQLRDTGLFELGVDAATPNPHIGFRLQARSLLYRAPNFDSAGIATSRWDATSGPSASVDYRF